MLPSVLWCCWLGGRKGIRPVKKLGGEVLAWWGAGVVICLKWLMRCRLASWCHCHSLSLALVKSRLVLPFWYRLIRVVPVKGPLNGCACVLKTPTHKIQNKLYSRSRQIIWRSWLRGYGGDSVCYSIVCRWISCCKTKSESWRFTRRGNGTAGWHRHSCWQRHGSDHVTACAWQRSKAETQGRRAWAKASESSEAPECSGLHSICHTNTAS